MKEKRRDSKGRILHTGESQRTDGKYLYKYVDAFGNTKYVYAWRLTPTDPTPKGKREKPSLRELEQQIIGQRRGLQSCGNGEAGPCLCRRGKRRRSEQYGADGQKRRYPACPSLHISSSLFAFSPIGRIW